MLYKRRERNNGKKKEKVTEIIKKTIGTKLITYIKKLKLIKIQSRVWNFKTTMLKKRRKKKKKQGQKIIKNMYMKFAKEEKIGFFFFCKVIGYKSEN